MYMFYSAGGYGGLIALRVLLMTVLGFLVIAACARESGPWATSLASALAFLSIWSRATERPQLISFCLLAAVLPPLRRWIGSGRNPWWLPPVLAAWANIHAMWSAALLLYGALVVGRILEVGVKNWRLYVQLLAIGVASLAAVLLNPSGYRLLSIFEVGGASFIGEFATPNLFDAINLPTTVLALIILVGWARSTTVVPPIDLVFVLAAVSLGAMYNRTVPIAAIALAPLAAKALGRSDRPLQSLSPAGTTRRRDRYSAAALAFVLLLAIAFKLPSIHTLVPGTPVAATRDLDALPGRARVLNEYGLGGWMVWAAQDTSPGIDGRSEIYSPSYVSSYLAALRMSPGWQEWLTQQPFDAAWLYSTTPLVSGLQSLGWRVYRNEGSTVILVPPS
jgi:hypothetical protein